MQGTQSSCYCDDVSSDDLFSYAAARIQQKQILESEGEQTGQTGPQRLSVSGLIQRFSSALLAVCPRVVFEGELSLVSKASSGHMYLSVKDENSQVDAVMFRDANSLLKFSPKVGSQVVCFGRPNIYPKSGRLQVVVERMELAGEGALRAKFEQMRERLSREGLFSPERKRALPFLPRAIGIVTSGSGAVIHDMQVRLRERAPQIPIYLVDTRVQGEGAASEIAIAIQILAQSNLVDVIVVARGGGSLEDLWAFNEEILVRAIFASSVPIVSAVGHEVDVTLSDLVADVRAPTPTAAAEMIVPRRKDLIEALDQYQRRLGDFARWLEPFAQNVDELARRLESAIELHHSKKRLQYSLITSRLGQIEPSHLLSQARKRLTILHQILDSNMLDRLREATSVFTQRENRLGGAKSLVIGKRREQLAALSSKLEGLSPVGALKRGFSLIEQGDKLVRSVKDVKPNDLISVRVSDGKFNANVIGEK